MELPILSKLKDGVKFDFATLAENVEQTDEFWDWWWSHEARAGELMRPEVIEDEDPILTETLNKPTVDMFSYSDLFDRTLYNTIQRCELPWQERWPRESFRELLIRRLKSETAILPGAPQIVFTGGGYGSGKTTAINYLAKNGEIPLQMPHMVGVDVFKNLMPEFHRIKAVADGRASTVVQKECQGLACDLFAELVESRRSFIWDSSMSNVDETLRRIISAKSAGYELTMIAILTTEAEAVRRAMERARDSRRFPHPTALPQSHREFRRHFNAYPEYFDEVRVFVNDTDGSESCLVAEKARGEKELAILHQELFLARVEA